MVQSVALYKDRDFVGLRSIIAGEMQGWFGAANQRKIMLRKSVRLLTDWQQILTCSFDKSTFGQLIYLSDQNFFIEQIQFERPKQRNCGLWRKY